MAMLKFYIQIYMNLMFREIYIFNMPMLSFEYDISKIYIDYSKRNNFFVDMKFLEKSAFFYQM